MNILLPSHYSFCRRIFLVYIALYGLILLYANAYSIWAFLSVQLGVLANYVPIVLSIVVFAVAAIAVMFKKGGNHSGLYLNKGWLVAGVICVIVALILPDANAPAKRIHVPEYLLVSFTVFTLQRRKLAGVPLVIFSVLITTLYGAHDEMIQGLLPTRSFGFKDILVDGLSGLGGVCMAYATFQTPTSNAVSSLLVLQKNTLGLAANRWFPIVMFLMVLQMLGVVVEHNGWLVFWVALYFVVVSGSYWFSLYKTNLWKINKAGMIVIYCLAFSLVFYLSSTALVSSLIFK